MKKLISLMLSVVMLFGLVAVGIAPQNARALSSPDPDYEFDNEDDLVYCTEKFAYDQGVNFFKLWWIANNEKDYFRELDFGYCPPYYSPVLKNRRDSSYMDSIKQWRIMSFQMDDWGPGFINNKIKAYVEGMLFNLLYNPNSDSAAINVTSEFTDINGDWSKNIQNFGVSIWKKITEDISEIKKETPVGPDFMQNQHDALVLDAVAEEFGFFDDVGKLFGYVETAGEYAEGIARLKEMVGTNQALEHILLGMKNQISNAVISHDYDPAYSSSLENFVSYFSDYMTEELAIAIFAGQKTAREVYSAGIDAVWGAASKAWIAAHAIDVAASTGKFLGNLLTGIDDQYNAFNELEVYFDIEQLLRMEIGSIIDECNRGNLAAAEDFPTAFALLENMYNIGLDCYETYADKLYRDGVLNNLWIIGDIQRDKYDNAINEAESMRESMKELFLHAEVGANNAYYEAVQKYNPELIEDAERKSVPSNLPPESEARDNFDALQPTFGMDLKEDKTMTRDLEIYGSIHLEQGTLNLSGHQLTVYGNVYIDGGEIVNRGILDVRGSVYQTAGKLTIPGGCSLLVGGDYVMSPSYGGTALNLDGGKATIGGSLIGEEGSSSYYSRLSVLSSAELEVGGDISLGDYDRADLTSGVVRLGGGFIAASSTYISGSSGCTVILRGTGAARVQNLAGVKLMIENAESRSITFANTVKLASLGGGNAAVTAENLYFGAGLANDLTINGDVTMRFDVSLNGHSLTVNGNVTQTEGTISANAPLTVTGGMTADGGYLNVNAGGDVNIGGAAAFSGSSHLTLTGGAMTTGGDVVFSGGSSDWHNYITVQEGATLDVHGKLQTGKYTSTSFKGGTVTVLDQIIGSESYISGSSGCTVVVGGTGDVRVQGLNGPKLTIENAADRAITFVNTVKVDSLGGGDMTVTPENLYYGGSLTGNLVIDGDVTISGNTSLNGHSLTVSGNVTQTDGTVTANAPLTVTGSMTASGGYLNVNAGGDVNIGGAAAFSGSSHLTLTGGAMTTGGDVVFSGGSSDWHNYITVQNGAVMDVHGKLQTGKYTSTSFKDCTVTVLDGVIGNDTYISCTSGTNFVVSGTGDVRVQGLNGPKLTIENAADRNVTFANTLKLNTLDGEGLTVTPENLAFSGVLHNDLTVNGDLTFPDSVTLQGHTLTVSGNLRQTAGTLSVGAGKLDVSGDYLIVGLSGGSDSVGSGVLSMNNESSVVKVGGNMTVWSSKASTLTDGALTIKGHFTQKGTSYVFTASGNHITVLDGTKLQRVTFENTNNKFNILRLGQYEEMYVFSPENCWNEMKVICDHAVTEVRGHVDATCTEDGYSGDTYCVLCGDLLDQGYVIEAEGHKIVVDQPVDPTCTEPGHTYGRHCSVCGKVFVQPTEIPALGHDWGEWVVTKAPTATQPGVETRTCKNDPSHTETREIPPTGGSELTITQQPQDFTGAVGETATFTVKATGDGLTYQWEYKDVGGAWTKSSFKTPSMTCKITAARDGRQYRCIVKDAGGSSVTSDAAAIIVKAALAITQQPQDFTGAVGETATFTVKATGEGLTYQWQYKDVGGSWANSSFKTATMTCKITAARDGRQYRCIVKDANNNSVTSAAAAIIVKAPGLAITQQPQDFTGAVGETATFTVKATGEGLTYQWQYKDPGGTWANSSFKAASMSCKLTAARNGRQYRCVVKDASGDSVTSSAATIIVRGAGPVVTQQPQDFYGKAGDTAAFSVTAVGDGLTYQWEYKDVGGAWAKSSFKTPSMTCKITAARDGRQYRCIVKDAGGSSVTSDAAAIIVKAALAITQQPQDFTGAVGETATFTVKATGEGLTYQWQYKDVGGSWANSSFKTAPMTCKITAARDGRQYRCIVTDAQGRTVTSDPAAIIIGTKLAVTAQPQDFKGSVGATASFSVTAVGDGLTYQWQYKDPGGSWANSSFKTATMTCKITAARDGRQYRCIITDAHGAELYSSAAAIRVTA